MAFKLYTPSKVQLANMGIIFMVTLMFSSLLSALIMGNVYAYQSTKALLFQMGLVPIPFIIILMLFRYYTIYVKPFVKYEVD